MKYTINLESLESTSTRLATVRYCSDFNIGYPRRFHLTEITCHVQYPYVTFSSFYIVRCINGNPAGFHIRYSTSTARGVYTVVPSHYSTVQYEYNTTVRVRYRATVRVAVLYGTRTLAVLSVPLRYEYGTVLVRVLASDYEYRSRYCKRRRTKFKYTVVVPVRVQYSTVQ